jgi:predicted RNA-binding protein with PUA-like domain
MTPQEKADELFKLYLDVGMGNGWTKQCALIAVNEIIESREDDSAFDDTMWENASEYYSPHPMYKNYWDLVKQEIIHRLDDIS